MASKHNVEDGLNDHDGGNHLLVVLRLGGQHDQVLGATHAVTSIVEALLPGDGQRVVDALKKAGDLPNIYDVSLLKISTLVTSKSPPSSKSTPSQKSLQRSKEHDSKLVWFLNS